MHGVGDFSHSPYGGSMCKKITSLLLVILLLVLTACQPTPESEVVVNKGDGVFEQKIEEAKKEQNSAEKTETEAPCASSEPAPTEMPVYEFESHWTDTVSLKNFNVDIDVDVEAPTVANFPVYRVKAGQFVPDDERIKTVCNVLMGEVVAVRAGEITLQDLKEQLEQLQLGQYDAQTETWQPYDKETYKMRAGEIMKEMEIAPDENDFVFVSSIQMDTLPTAMTYRTQDGSLWIVDCSDNGVSISRYLRSTRQPERWVVTGHAISGEKKGTTLQNVSCTEEEARRFAMDFIESVHIGEMDISSMEKGRMVDLDTLEVLKEGWIVECARTGGSCGAVNYRYVSKGASLRYNDDAYSAGLSAESIVLFVDDKGVASFSWSSPLEIVKTEVENVEILPFEQAQELMKQAMFNGLSWTGNKERGSAYRGVYVLRVALSYCFTPVKDSPEEYYFTPTWFVFMQFYDRPADASKIGFAINAVDGTRIDLSSVR